MHIPLIGVSQSIDRIRELIKHVSDTGLNIVISGESGVGKEVVAQNLYFLSPRSKKPFIKINCAALPEGLLESELFGYERGAFTGAEQRRRGKFELAHGGILFLDEIGDMPLLLQSKLLHVLQSGEFSPLGSEKDVHTDTWIIAATNHELEEDIRNGKFREDLYYRLNIIKIHIPPLRERPEDIPPLIDHYFNEYATQFNGKKIQKPNSLVIQKLVTYQWPGNVRELQNVLKRSFVISNWDEILAELQSWDSPVPVESTPGRPVMAQDTAIMKDIVDFKASADQDLSSFSLKEIKKKALDKVEREVLTYVLNQTGWNRTKAAKILKISYKTLLYKISDLKIQPPSNLD